LHVSHSVFYRRFQEALGRSPHQEILRLRLERVKNLLRQTRISLEQIAALTGFEHSEYLSVLFKREIGITPGDFRQRQQGKL
jgi:LacI family transcriptional regulator